MSSRRCLFAAAIAMSGACTPGFEDPSRIRDLRLLAVMAEPPEVLVDAQNLPTEFPTFVLRPLVVDPRGPGRVVRYTVRACGNAGAGEGEGRDRGPGNVRDTISQSACSRESPVIAEGQATVGADAVVPIEVSFTPTIEFLTAALRSDPLGAALGLPVTLGFNLIGADEENQVAAIKRVLFSPRLSPEQKPNANPRIESLSFRKLKGETPMPIDPAAPPEIPLGGRLDIVASMAEAEPYQAPAYDNRTGTFTIERVEKETLRYAFYATRGTFSPGGFSTEPSPLLNNPVIELVSTYRAPGSLAPGESPDVDVFVVVRDERGGASFARTRLRLRAP